MSLTQAQLQEFKTALLASQDATIQGFIAAGNHTDLTAYLNINASPVTKAWIADQSVSNSDDAPDYSTYDGLVAGKRDSWNLFLRNNRDFTRNKVRKWVTDVWGNSTAGSNSEAILQSATRNSTNFELLFAHSTASTGTVTSEKLTVVGPVSLTEVSTALNLP